MKYRREGLAVAMAVLATPSLAHAHLVNSGIGPFYDGALHLLLSPMDLARLLALSLFAGAQSPASARFIVMAAPAAWFFAGLAALNFAATDTFGLANGTSLLALGVLIAADLRLPRGIAAAIGAGYGAFLGFQSGAALQLDKASWVTLLGTAAVAGAIVLTATALVASAKPFPLRVGCRVLGSWAAAIGLLSLGWIIAAPR